MSLARAGKTEEGTMMPDTESTTAKTFLVAIDIGKAFHAVLVEGPDDRRQPFHIRQQRGGP